MRGRFRDQGGLFSYISPESRVAESHPLRRVWTEQHTAAANCGRAVDRIRQIIAPSLDGAAAWQETHKTLNISRGDQEWVSKQSKDTRHGDNTFVSGAVISEVIQRTWALLNRCLEYQKRGSPPLAASDLPELVWRRERFARGELPPPGHLA
jgi:hypothetical protein